MTVFILEIVSVLISLILFILDIIVKKSQKFNLYLRVSNIFHTFARDEKKKHYDTRIWSEELLLHQKRAEN